jgi:cobalt-zinc-cadmium efflux system membrane fusion protein
MKNKILILIIAVIFPVFCGKKEYTGSDDHNHDHGEETVTPMDDNKTQKPGHEKVGEQNHENEKETAADHDHLHIGEEKITGWGIAFGSPEERDFVEKIFLTGVVQVDRNATYLINSFVPGVVTAVKKDIGDSVAKGTVLCILNSPELLALKTRYIKAHQEFLLTMQDYGRAKNLFADKAIEMKELINREAKYKTSLAEYLSLEAELHSSGFSRESLRELTQSMITGETGKLKEFLSPFYEILAPIAGKVISRDLTHGELIEKNRTIYEISDTRKLWVILDVKETDLKHIEKGAGVEIFSDGYPGTVFTGKVAAIPEKLDAVLRTVKVRVEMENETYLLKPEMYVRGTLGKNIRQGYLAVPAEALVKMSGSDGLFLKETDGFVFKPVQVVERDSRGFVFITGVSKDEVIVTKGTFYLKAEYEISRGAVDAHAGHQH